MNQSQLTRALAAAFGRPHTETQKVLRFLINKIATTLPKKERVVLRDFGVFLRKERAAKTVRHPKTGKMIAISAHPTANFRPSPSLEKRLK